jgi:hypothetical protein
MDAARDTGTPGTLGRWATGSGRGPGQDRTGQAKAECPQRQINQSNTKQKQRRDHNFKMRERWLAHADMHADEKSSRLVGLAVRVLRQTNADCRCVISPSAGRRMPVSPRAYRPRPAPSPSPIAIAIAIATAGSETEPAETHSRRTDRLPRLPRRRQLPALHGKGERIAIAIGRALQRTALAERASAHGQSPSQSALAPVTLATSTLDKAAGPSTRARSP